MGKGDERELFKLYPSEAKELRESYAYNVAEHAKDHPDMPTLRVNDQAMYKRIRRAVNIKDYPYNLPNLKTLFRLAKFFDTAPHNLIRPRPKVAGSERRVQEHPAPEGVRKITKKTLIR